MIAVEIIDSSGLRWTWLADYEAEENALRALDGFIERGVILDVRPNGAKGSPTWRLNAAQIVAFRLEED